MINLMRKRECIDCIQQAVMSPITARSALDLEQRRWLWVQIAGGDSPSDDEGRALNAEENRMISRSSRISSTIVLAVVGAGLLRLLPQPVDGGGTPATGSTTDQLINQQGSGVPTEYGDYIASSSALDSSYSYWLEVPSGLARLVVEIFDADVYAGGAADLAGERDRQLTSGGSVEYRLFDPSGTEVTTTNFTDGNATSPSGADNAWLVFYDTQAVASFADVTTAANTAGTPPIYESLSTATNSSDVTSLTINLPSGTDFRRPAGGNRLHRRQRYPCGIGLDVDQPGAITWRELHPEPLVPGCRVERTCELHL